MKYILLIILMSITTSGCELLTQTGEYYITFPNGQYDRCTQFLARYACGAHLSKCDSTQEYKCATNVIEVIKK